MSVAKNRIATKWSTADTLSIASSGNGTSDIMTHSASAFKMDVELKADNNGTPASGDTVDFYLLPTTGDVGATSSDVYATVKHGVHLATLDTNAEDPAVCVVSVEIVSKSCKIYAVNNSSGRGITVSAAINEYTA